LAVWVTDVTRVFETCLPGLESIEWFRLGFGAEGCVG
jgi:hypothetical protein